MSCHLHSRSTAQAHVSDNALRRTTIANLQEEVAKLHLEVLKLRETNIHLSNQVKRLQDRPGRNIDQVGRRKHVDT